MLNVKKNKRWNHFKGKRNLEGNSFKRKSVGGIARTSHLPVCDGQNQGYCVSAAPALWGRTGTAQGPCSQHCQFPVPATGDTLTIGFVEQWPNSVIPEWKTQTCHNTGRKRKMTTLGIQSWEKEELKDWRASQEHRVPHLQFTGGKWSPDQVRAWLEPPDIALELWPLSSQLSGPRILGS